jgi:phage shock protein A
MNDFEKLWNVAMSEASAKLDSLSDEEIERIVNESNLASKL